MVIDGGPRKNMNTAAMVQAFVEGAQEGSADVKVVRLYDIDYKDFSIVAPKKMPVTMIYTMNASPEQAPGTLQNMKGVEAVLGMSFGNTPEVIMANNTTQVNDYSRYHFTDGTAKAKKAWRDTHWEEDLQKAREAGKRMATNE